MSTTFSTARMSSKRGIFHVIEDTKTNYFLLIFFGGLASTDGSISSGESPLMLNKREARSESVPPHLRPLLMSSLLRWSKPSDSKSRQLSKASKSIGGYSLGSAAAGGGGTGDFFSIIISTAGSGEWVSLGASFISCNDGLTGCDSVIASGMDCESSDLLSAGLAWSSSESESSESSETPVLII